MLEITIFVIFVLIVIGSIANVLLTAIGDIVMKDSKHPELSDDWDPKQSRGRIRGRNNGGW